MSRSRSTAKNSSRYWPNTCNKTPDEPRMRSPFIRHNDRHRFGHRWRSSLSDLFSVLERDRFPVSRRNGSCLLRALEDPDSMRFRRMSRNIPDIKKQTVPFPSKKRDTVCVPGMETNPVNFYEQAERSAESRAGRASVGCDRQSPKRNPVQCFSTDLWIR